MSKQVTEDLAETRSFKGVFVVVGSLSTLNLRVGERRQGHPGG